MVANIVDFGANIGNRDNASYIQKAVDSLIYGGEVLIPTGIFYTSTFYLRSNISLRLEAGAVLKAVEDAGCYASNGLFDSFGKETTSFLIARDCENITICGDGMIDLSGKCFLDYEISQERKDFYGEERAEKSTAIPKMRITRPILFDHCCSVKVTGIKIQDSPCWTLTFHGSKNIRINNIEINNHPRTPHSDGIHLSGCDRVTIADCTMICGDDCIAITSLLDYSRECKNIVITNCVLSSSSAAIRIGHKESKVKNVLIENICITDTNRGIAIFAGEEGRVQNVKISHVTMDTHILTMEWWGRGEPIVICSANSTGVISNISICDVYAEAENKAVAVGTIEDLCIDRCDIHLVDRGGRKYAAEYDISPNGKLNVENDFKGSWYKEFSFG